MSRRAVAAFSAAAILWGACAPGPRPQSGKAAAPASLEEGAREVLGALTSAYQNNEAEAFIERVDDRAFPDFVVFRERSRDFLRDNRQISLDIVVDAVVPDAAEVSIAAHWNKGWVGRDGRHRLDKGRCELMFRRQPSGALALSAIRGDPPF